MKTDKWKQRLYDGISCVLVNSDRGMELLRNVPDLDMVKSNVNKITENNGQLREPTMRPADRDEIMEIYRQQGYLEIDKRFRNQLGYKRYILELKSRIPTGLKRKVRSALG